MKGLLRCLLLAACLLPMPGRALEPSQVVVVYNAESELSKSTAERYAQLRRIPADNLIGLAELKGGHISRLDFEQKIRLPLLAEGKRRGLRWPSGYTRGSTRQIHAMVLMPDMPLGILGTPRPKDAPPPGKMAVDHAAVDSELMLLGANVPLAGMLNNPAYNKEFRLGPGAPPVMAVCRIDGPDADTIRRMIEDPVRVEKQGLWGWTVIDRGGPYPMGEEWLAAAARQTQTAGMPLFYETSRRTLAESFPLMTDTAVYLGWYTHPANGPFKPAAAGGFRFAPGAVAVHIHSNSASSVKNATYWVGALLKRGAAVTAGNVFEPYLGPCLHLDVFHDRLLKGYCVAEAALMASPVASWQSLILGDPLYRPFAPESRRAASNVYAEWKRLRLECRDDPAALARAVRARAQQAHGAALAEMLAWHCAEQGKNDYAVEFFTQACGHYTHLRDRTRAAIMAATAMVNDGQKERAVETLRRWVAAGADSPYLPALQKSLEAITGEQKPKAKP